MADKTQEVKGAEKVSGKAANSGGNKNENLEPMPFLQRITIVIYFLVWVLACIYIILKTWPLSGTVMEGAEISYFFGMISVYLNPEVRVLILVVTAGALGACIHLGTSFAYHAGRSNLEARWFWWYIKRPFIGASLAVIFYFVFRGGLLTAGAPSGDLNIYGVLGFSGLVGMFSRQAIEKLGEIFNTLFRKSEKGGKGEEAGSE